MPALRDLDMLTRACQTLMPTIDEIEKGFLDELARSGRTTSVNGLRAMRLNRLVVAVGMFSVFEAALKEEYGWQNLIEEIERTLLRSNQHPLWVRFEQYWLANNVLKHGAGRSLVRLVEQRDQLDFEVRAEGEEFFEEGVVNEIHARINITNPFIQNAADLIERVVAILSQEPRHATQ